MIPVRQITLPWYGAGEAGTRRIFEGDQKKARIRTISFCTGRFTRTQSFMKQVFINALNCRPGREIEVTRRRDT